MAGDGSGAKLGWVHGIALVVGGIVGSGLFVSPGDVFAMCGSVGWGLVVWVLAGVLCLMGGVCYAELGCAVRRSGGEYAILTELLGAPFAFAFAWMSFWIQCPSAVGVLSLTFARYVGAVVFPLDVTAEVDHDWRVRGIAIVSIFFVGLANSFGLRGGALANTVVTGLKLVAILGVLMMGLSQLPTGLDHFRDPFTPNAQIQTGGTPSMITLAVISALWSYDGWNMLNYIAGEVDVPERNLPRCVIWGMGVVMLVTILTNISFLLILPPNVVATNKALAVTAGEKLFGPAGGYAMSLVVAINVYGVMQTCLLSYPFIYNEAALDGLFPSFLTDEKRDIALPAIWIPMVMAVGMVMVGSFTVLTQVYGVTTYCFYVLSMVSLIRLRNRGIISQYRVPFHPLLAVLFILCSVVLIGNAMLTAPVQSAGGVAFCLLSLPVYLAVRRLGWGKPALALGQEPLLQSDSEADQANRI